MVTTRSKSSTTSAEKAIGTKIKFSDADSYDEQEYNTAEDDKNKYDDDNASHDKIVSESESDSDEAPEEESVSTSKQDFISAEKENAKFQRETALNQKERRKRRDSFNKKQQEKKRKKHTNDIDIPEFIPEDVLDDMDEASNDGAIEAQRQHLKLDNFDMIDKKSTRTSIKQQKLDSIRRLNKISVKKGPVHVQVQSLVSQAKKIPKSQTKVVNMRDKWLNRKSLGKR